MDNAAELAMEIQHKGRNTTLLLVFGIAQHIAEHLNMRGRHFEELHLAFAHIGIGHQ